MSKLTVLQCSVCKRNIEIETDPRRVDPINCIITNRCTGKLSKIGEKNTRTSMYPTPVTGVQDWTPRGVTLTPRKEVSSSTLSLLCGANHIAIAIPESIGEKIELRFKNNHSTYSNAINYYFIRGMGTTGLAGADDSTSRNILCNVKGDIVKIHNNGVEMSDSSYQLYENKIQFLQPLTLEKNVLTVSIYNSIPAHESLLSFKKPNVFGNAAWDNIKKIELNGEIYNVLICDDLSGFILGQSYVLSTYDYNQEDISKAYFLLSSYPHSSYDRILTTTVNAESTMNDKTIFDFKYGKLINDFLIPQDNAINIFPQLKIVDRISYALDFAVDSQQPIEHTTKINNNIIGPI